MGDAGTGDRYGDHLAIARLRRYAIPSPTRRTFVLVDGENIDATLGVTILGHRPEPNERPRWERVIDFARRLWGQEVTGLFFLNASSGYLPGPFVAALQGIGFRPVPLSGERDEKVVDIGIQRTMAAITALEADVLLLSHDRDFVDNVVALLDSGSRVDLIGFPELVSGAYGDLDITIHDLETEVKAFNTALPRIRIIPIGEFDPTAFLR